MERNIEFKQITKVEQLEDCILESIKNGIFKANEKIPSERELAKKYNISVLTVNKALSNLVSKGVVYRKNGVGTFVSSEFSKFIRYGNRQNKLGLVIFGEVKKFEGKVFSGIVDEIKEIKSDNNIEIISCENQRHLRLQIQEIIKSKSLEGLLFLHLAGYNYGIELCKANSFPYVILDMPLIREGYNFILRDHKKGAYNIVEYLIKLGHKKIACIRGEVTIPFAHDWEIAKFYGYREALEKHGLTFDEELVEETVEFTEEAGGVAIKEILKRRKDFTAVFATNVMKAVGVMKTLLSMGIKIPTDISVAGFNNISPISIYEVPLTTVDVPDYEVGREGVKLLLDIINKYETSPVYREVETKLIIRDSTSKPKQQF